ncbi:glycosyl hydrolase [Dysgonomonas sp. ZJ709]|uniref:glycosyl hydrolase n=1 Tax=Dysgonomonas sp. ZJ709 TaxID=2709797 RepID=UPI0013E9ADA4|nr:glycosyl hydrolase [Dysgonomonas sp. ZJ709]
MKNALTIIIVLLFFSCNSGNIDDTPSGINDFSSLEKEFADPSKEYRTAPLYVWNTKVTTGIIDSTLTDLKAKGFGGVFIHPRPGMVTEYMSDDWYNLYKHAIAKGKELDMNIWIYDENSYPSGFAGGHVPAEMPESYNQGGGLEMLKVEVLPDTVSQYYLCLKDENGQMVDITAKVKDEQGKKGTYYLFAKTYERKSPWYGGFSYVDLLYPRVTQKFIEITMDGYKKHIGEEFGKTVPGWFTDEPNINTTGGIRWTPDLFDVFQKEWGYDLKVNLPSLYEETGNWKEVRHNYTQTLLQLFIDRWAKPCFEYCEQNNLEFTGHYWEHGWPDVGHGGDNMAMYAWHQTPAIDMLFNQFNEESPQAQFGNIRAVKELASVANQMGNKRTLSETYGGGGWEETFTDLKRLGDWEYVLGVNFMNQHLSHLTISGARKYDYPPSFSAHTPWWPYYKTLNDHYARLSMALSSGQQKNDILILEPTTSVWLYYSYRRSNPELMTIGTNFQNFVTTLEKAQVEYDLGSENIIKDQGKVTNNGFGIGKRNYSKVVIPPLTENLDLATFNLLKEFSANGGIILAFSKPTLLNGKASKEVTDFFAEGKAITYLQGLSPATISEYFGSPKISFADVQGGNLLHHRREMKDGNVLFLVNSSLDEAVKGKVSIVGKDAVELNTLTGEMLDYTEIVNGDKVSIDYNIPPAGSLLLYVFDKKQDKFEPSPKKANKYEPVVAKGEVKVKADKDNILAIDFCDLYLGKDIFKDIHMFDAADKVFKYHGFVDGNPWNTSVQYKDNIVKRDTFQTGGFKVIYKFAIDGDFDMSAMQATIERSWLYKISLNGKEIKTEQGVSPIDPQMRVFNIGGIVKKGENQLVLELSPMKIMAEIEPIYISGAFAVKPIAKGFAIIAPQSQLNLGSWKEQGLPFYGQIVTYSKAFEIPKMEGVYRVSLGEWAGSVAEVLVNDKSAGLIITKPYNIDVTKLMNQGENKVEIKIVGSNKNLLGPFHKAQKGIVGPWQFRGVPAYPAGNAYDQLDYGLMTDFNLEVGQVN